MKTLHQYVTMRQVGLMMKIDQSFVYPDKQVQRISLPVAEILQVVTPEVAFISTAKELKDIPPSERGPLDSFMKRDFLNVLQHVNDPKYAFAASSKETLGHTEATVMDVNADGLTMRWWIGDDGTLLQEQHSETGKSGPETLTTKYCVWRNFGGLQYPAKHDVFSNGEEQAVFVINDMEVNATVDPKLFEKPQK